MIAYTAEILIYVKKKKRAQRPKGVGWVTLDHWSSVAGAHIQEEQFQQDMLSTIADYIQPYWAMQ